MNQLQQQIRADLEPAPHRQSHQGHDWACGSHNKLCYHNRLGGHPSATLNSHLSNGSLPRSVPMDCHPDPGDSTVPHLLVIHKLPMPVNLVFHGEVDCGPVHVLAEKDLHFGPVFFILKIPDHVGEPNCQAVVTGREKTDYLNRSVLSRSARIPGLR